MVKLMASGLAAVLNLADGDWLVINDDVMGGRSTARVIPTPEGLRFEGTLSLENNGGFSSTRRLVGEVPPDAQGIRLEVRGDGRRYQARVRQDQNFDGVSWRASFETTGDWQSLDLPFELFEPVFRGRPVPSAGPVDASAVRQFGFLLADKQPGTFRLEVRRIGFLKPGPE